MDSGSEGSDGGDRPEGSGDGSSEGGGSRRRGRGRSGGSGESGSSRSSAGNGGGKRPGDGGGRPGGNRGGAGGRGAGGNQPGQGSRGNAGGRGGGNRPGQGPRGTGRGPAGRGRGDDQQSPIEVAARSTRNAIRRHAESLRDDDSRLACRSMLTALVASSRGMASPAELLATIEQFGHVIEDSAADTHQLQVTLRAVAAFTSETPRRVRDVAEMVRLLLRFGYVVAADHLPRSFRDDGSFRGSALADQLESIVPEYLDDARFAELSRR